MKVHWLGDTIEKHATQITTIIPCPLPAGENLTMVFTLKEWGAQSRSFTVKNTPTTQTPVTEPVTEPATTQDGSVFGSSTAVSAGSLCLVSVIYAVACCSDDIPIC